MQTFVLVRGRPPPIHDLRDLVDLMAPKYDGPSVDIRPLRVALQHELSDDPEVRAAAADAEEKIDVLVVARSENGPICNYDGSLRRKVGGISISRHSSSRDIEAQAYLDEVVDCEAVFRAQPAIPSTCDEPTQSLSIMIYSTGKPSSPADTGLKNEDVSFGLECHSRSQNKRTWLTVPATVANPCLIVSSSTVNQTAPPPT